MTQCSSVADMVFSCQEDLLMLCTLTLRHLLWPMITFHCYKYFSWYICYMSSKPLLKCNNLAELGESKCLSHWLSNVEASGQWQWEVNVSFYHVCTAINFLMQVSTGASKGKQGCLIRRYSWLNLSMLMSPPENWTLFQDITNNLIFVLYSLYDWLKAVTEKKQ